MKKVITYFGLFIIASIVFIGLAEVSQDMVRYLADQVEIIDDFYRSDLYSIVMIGLILMPILEGYSCLKKICEL